jgi:serine/threonine protein kinase
MVHRDIKPANVQLCEDGRVVLIDFGLAAQPAMIESAAIAGSLPYIAPEIFQQGRYSPASDLYALGVLVYASLTGSTPKVDITNVTGQCQVTTSFDPLPSSAAALRGVVRGLLAPDPSRRLTATQLARILA